MQIHILRKQISLLPTHFKYCIALHPAQKSHCLRAYFFSVKKILFFALLKIKNKHEILNAPQIRKLAIYIYIFFLYKIGRGKAVP